MATPIFEAEPVAHEIAKLEDALICYRVVREESFFPPRDKAQRVEEAEMLRDIGLAQPSRVDDIGDSTLPSAKRI